MSILETHSLNNETARVYLIPFWSQFSLSISAKSNVTCEVYLKQATAPQGEPLSTERVLISSFKGTLTTPTYTLVGGESVWITVTGSCDVIVLGEEK